MLRRYLLLALLLLAITAGGAGWQFTRETARAEPAPNAAPAAVSVLAGIAQQQDVPIYLTGLGTVQAFNTVTIRARIDGQLDRIDFKEGQDVKLGDRLAQIDPRPFQAQLAQAEAAKAKDEAQLANAKRDLDRFSNLATREFASRQSVDTQKAMVAQLQAAIQGDQATIDNAKVQLGYTTIVSPITGRTGIRLVDQGNIVHANDATGIVVITQVQPISVIFTLPQDVLDQVTAEMAKGPLTVAAFKRDDKTQLGEGEVAVIDNQIDPAAGTMRIRANFPNQNNALWPGQFVNARLLLNTRHNAVTVPLPVMQRGPQGTFAYVIKPDSTVEQRAIKVGPVRDGVALVEEGLAAGERVVIDGQYKLRAGTRVDPGSPPANSSPADNSSSRPAGSAS